MTENLLDFWENIPPKISPIALEESTTARALKGSQFGDDGIIREVMKRLSISNGTFFEFGAVDGVTICNSRQLWESGWSGMFIEPNPVKFDLLIQNYKNDPKVVCLLTQVDTTDNNINNLINRNLGRCPDFLCIDIDGPDFDVLEHIGNYRPAVIHIEVGIVVDPNQTFDSATNRRDGHPLGFAVEFMKKNWLYSCFVLYKCYLC